MSYIKPSVLVYQELQNAGGTANVTPDLGSVIVGPLYNVVRVDVTDTDSLAATKGAESSDLSALPSASNVSYTVFNNVVTVTSSNHGLEAGNIIQISGDTAGDIANNTRVVVTEAGRDTFKFNFVLADSSTTSSLDYSYVGLRVDLSGTTPGQLVEQSSVQLYATDAYVKTTQFNINLRDVDSTFFNGGTTRDELKFNWSNGTNSYGQVFTPAGALPETLLPDNSNKHVVLNDKVVIEYTDPVNRFEGVYSVTGANTVNVYTIGGPLAVGREFVPLEVSGTGNHLTDFQSKSFLVTSAAVSAGSYSKFVITSPFGALTLSQSAATQSYTAVSGLITVTSVGHGLETGDKIITTAVTGDVVANTVYSITKVDADTFTFTVTGADTAGTVSYTQVFDMDYWYKAPYSITDGVVTVTRPAHGLSIGDIVSVAGEYGPGPIVTASTQKRVVTNVPSTSTFTFDTTLRDHPAVNYVPVLSFKTHATYVLSSNVVTVTYTAHGLVSNNRILIEDESTGLIADRTQVQVTVVDSDTFTFTYTGSSRIGELSFALKGGLPYAISSNVVTVTYNSHPYATGQKVIIRGDSFTGTGKFAADSVHEITGTNLNDFSFAYTASDRTDVAAIDAYTVPYSITTNVATITKSSHGLIVGDVVLFEQDSYTGGDAKLSGKFVVTSVSGADFTVNITASDRTGFVKAGEQTYVVIYKDVVHETKVSKVLKVKNNSGVDVINSVKIASPVPDVSFNGHAITGTVSVYRHYDVIELPGSVSLDNGVPDDQIDYSKLDDGYIVLEDVFSAYKNVSSTLIPGVDEDSYAVLSGKFHIAYRAARQDKYTTILTLNDTAEIEAALGDVSELNPLALGVSLANSNTTTSVMAVSLKGEVVDGEIVFDWDTALELLENQSTAYALAPMTQDEAVLSKFKTHVLQMSEPKNASWRVLICNTEIPAIKYVLSSATEAADPEVALTTGRTKDIGGVLYFTDSATAGGPDFIEAAVTPGDQLVVTACVDADLVGVWTVDEVINGKTLKLVEASFSTPGITVGVSATYYIQRTLTKAMQAEHILATSEVFNSNRVWHVQPDIVGVNVRGSVKYLPGYYLCAALSGMTAGFPVQQGFTNISVAGIDDLKHSNFYFKKEQLNSTISSKAGTCWFVQDTQGGIPYCRHELTTDNSVLEYAEILKVKNWDYLSYYYYDKLRPFIGSWNITDDTMSNMKQILVAASELLLKQKLPRVGAPLLSYQQPTVEQDATNKDTTNVRIPVAIVDPNNYTNLYIVI